MQGWQSEASIRNYNQPQQYANNNNMAMFDQSQLFKQTQQQPVATHPNFNQITFQGVKNTSSPLPTLQYPTLPAYSPMAYMPGVGNPYELKPSTYGTQAVSEIETLKQTQQQLMAQVQQLQQQLQMKSQPIQQAPQFQQVQQVQQHVSQPNVSQAQQKQMSNLDWRNSRLPASARAESARLATFDALPVSNDFQSWDVGGGVIQTTSGSPVEFAHTLSAARGDLSFDQRQQSLLTDKNKNYLEALPASTFDHNDDYTYIDMSAETFSSSAETLQMQRGM
jgi:hypothetical protein